MQRTWFLTRTPQQACRRRRVRAATPANQMPERQQRPQSRLPRNGLVAASPRQEGQRSRVNDRVHGDGAWRQLCVGYLEQAVGCTACRDPIPAWP